MRRAGRTDGNQRDTVDLLRRAGWSVSIASPLGDAFPDLVVARGGWFTALVELKRERDRGKPSTLALTDGQRKFRDEWQGVHVHAVSPVDALAKLEDAYVATMKRVLGSGGSSLRQHSFARDEQSPRAISSSEAS